MNSMMKRNLLTLILAISVICTSVAQKRYLEPVFSGVTKNTLIYGYNYHILFAASGNSTLQPLVADLYSPTGDTETKRPLVIYFHSGNFLPHPQNQSISGTRSDSTVVEMSRRLARMGYVVASADHRLGWNPVAPEQDTRVNTLINAAYRGVQDANSAIRYFKLNAATYGIDTNKIILWGQGTGGYITLNTGALDKYSEIVTTTNPESKFIGTNGFPMVIEQFNGNIEGTTLGVLNAPGHPLNGDTLSIPNNVGPSSKFHLIVNMGGAMGDISWVDENTPPIISFQTTNDPFAPYKDDVLIVPGPNLPVVQVQGAYVVQQKVKDLGLNAAFADHEFIDPLSVYISSINEGNEGLFPMYKANRFDSSPWDYWDRVTNANDTTGIKTNPDMSYSKASLYMDSIINYVAPRACLVLDLGCDLTGILSGKVITADHAGLTAMPNPANDYVTILSETRIIKGIIIYDASGRAVKAIPDVNATKYELLRNNLPPGIYYAQVRFEKENASVKLIFN